MAEEAVADVPLDNLEWYHEKYILDYFAEVGLFLNNGLPVWAETTLRQLIKLRCESPDIGPDHEETFYLQRYLEQALRDQKKEDEANEIKTKLASIGMFEQWSFLFHIFCFINSFDLLTQIQLKI